MMLVLSLDITIPAEIYGYKVIAIGNGAFYRNHNIKTVTILANLDDIHNLAFFNCDSLEKVEIKGSVKNIGERAFRNCYELKTVKLTNGLWEFSINKSSKHIG